MQSLERGSKEAIESREEPIKKSYRAGVKESYGGSYIEV